MLTLYHGRTSVCSVKARLALAEKGVAFDSKLLTLRGDQYDPDYMALNPNAVVPTLVHDGHVVIESSVIIQYIDDAFSGAPLMPAEPRARVKARMTMKLIDEAIHTACMTLTFATVNRATLASLSAHEMEEELAKAPDPRRAELKRAAVAHGLDAAPVKQALRNYDKLLDQIEAAVRHGPYIAGAVWSLADAAATPYVWRLDKLKLAPMWAQRPGVAQWYERVRARPSFKAAVDDWITPADHARYDQETDPWPKVREILQAT